MPVLVQKRACEGQEERQFVAVCGDWGAEEIKKRELLQKMPTTGQLLLLTHCDEDVYFVERGHQQLNSSMTSVLEVSESKSMEVNITLC